MGRALDFIRARQYTNGGFGERGRPASEQLTAWAIVAIASAGHDPNTFKRGRSPVTYLASQSGSWRSTTDFARTTLAVVAAGKNPRSFGGVDLVAKILDAVVQDGSGGDRIGPMVNSHIWSMIALRAAGEDVTEEQIGWLRGQQNSDGGWGYGQNVRSDSNDTAAAIQALIASGESRDSTVVRNAVAYLKRVQCPDAGFSYMGSMSDAASTSWVVQGLVAAGESPGGAAWKKGSHTPLSRLCALQADTGAVRYTASRFQNPLFMTVQAAPAFALRPFPVKFSSHFSSAPSLAPVFRLMRPVPNSSLSKGSSVRVSFSVIDPYNGTGVPSGNISVRIDGVARSKSVRGGSVVVEAGRLSVGTHTIAVSATDRAGNSATMADWKFGVGAAVAAEGPARSGGAQAAASTAATGSAETSGSAATSATASGETTVYTGAPDGTLADDKSGSGDESRGLDFWAENLDVDLDETEAGFLGRFGPAGVYPALGLAFLVPAVGGVSLIRLCTDKSRRRRRKSRRG